MNTICKMIGIRRLSYLDVAQNTGNQRSTVYEFTENTKGNIKNIIDYLLFENRMDNVLVNYNNQLFVCLSTDFDKRQYSKKNLTYHPLSNIVNI